MYVLRHRRPFCILALEDGGVFRGCAVGAHGEHTGEVIFNTGMTGYQEVLTDPSYCGQIVVMTSPLIGNYGTNDEDIESASPMVAGFVMREMSREPSNWRSTLPLDEYLKKRRIVAGDDLDTRAITLRIREKGAMRACISTEDDNGDRLVEKARASPSMVGLNLADGVSCRKPYEWHDEAAPKATGKPLKVVVYDFGVKRSILQCLGKAGCAVTVVPSMTAPEEVLDMSPDGVVLSNGPGDPEPVQ